MRVKSLSISLAFILLALSATSAHAKQNAAPSRDWAVVKALANENKLIVKTKDGKKFEGTLTAVSDTNITITKKNQTFELDATIVAQVYLLTSKSVNKSIGEGALIGLAVGFGAGAIFGFALGGLEEGESRAGTAVVFGLFFGIVGAGAGAFGGLISSLWKKKTLIYVAG